MPRKQIPTPNDLVELSQKLEQWRSEQTPRSRLPETIWAAAADMAERHGLNRTSKVLRLDYMRLKKHMGSASLPPAKAAAPAFLELLQDPSSSSGEYVVELESACGRMRVSMKGATPD